MRNLIIIGNGFDLAHNLKTDYLEFKNDVKKNSEKYGIQRDYNNYLLTRLLEDSSNLWSDIEALYFDILININNRTYLQKKHFPTQHYRDVLSLNSDFEKITNYLNLYLLEREQKFIPIENYEIFFKEFNSKESVVVNFNYTKTVKYYLENTDIDLIHIHGELENEENPIIFGYAANDKESKQLLIENNNNYVKNIKKFSYLFTNNEFKLKEHLNSVEYNVFILGHSCGISDSLILSQIFNSKNIHQIIPFYFMDRNGYFNTMVNVDRIIDDYSKRKEDEKFFNKLLSFPDSFKMPQRNIDHNLIHFLHKILNEKLPSEKRKVSSTLL